MTIGSEVHIQLHYGTPQWWIYVNTDADFESGPSYDQFVERFDTIEDAVDILASVPQGAVKLGNEYGPQTLVMETARGHDDLWWSSDRALHTQIRAVPRDRLTKRFEKRRAELRRRGMKFNPGGRR